MDREIKLEREPKTINQLVRTDLELEQFECQKCGRVIYIPKSDLEVERQNKDSHMAKKQGKDALIVVPECPYKCEAHSKSGWSETLYRRTLKVVIRKVTNIKLSVGDVRRNGG
jgi:hypothetical protein